MRILSWRALLPLLAMMTLIVAAGCPAGQTDTTPAPGAGTPAADGTPAATGTPAAATGDADADQTLRVYSTEPDTLDPQRATDTVSLAYLSTMYAMLLRIDENQEVQPWLATEIPTVENGGISEDGLTYTLTLRDGLKWSDGEPLVAQHFVDGAKRLFEPGTGNYYVDFYRVLAAPGSDGQDLNVEIEKALAEDPEADVADLEGQIQENIQVTAPDEKTIVYTLNRRSPVFSMLLTMWPLYPVRQDVIDQHGDAWTEAGNHISNGPFVLQSWRHNEDIVLEKNPNYHDADNVALQTITVDMIEDSNVAFLAYQNNELDLVKLGPAELVQVRQNADLQEEFTSYGQLVTIGTYFNFDYEPLRDVRVRQALTAAMDRDELVNVVLEGAALPAYSWIPPGMPGHDPEAGLQYQNAEDKAKQWMEEAGYNDGNKLELEILISASNTAKLIAEWQKEQWESKLPVTVTINQVETATYFAERNAGNYQVTGGGWGADYPDPQNWMPLWQTGGGLNSGDYSNPDFDALIEQAAEELDNEKRIDLYMQSQRVMMDDPPFAPMYHRARQILVKPWVKGLVPSAIEHDIPGDVFMDRVSISGRQ